MMMASLPVLLSGCVKSEYCDVAFPLRFGGQETIDFLIREDREFLEDTVIHNETYAELCNVG